LEIAVIFKKLARHLEFIMKIVIINNLSRYFEVKDLLMNAYFPKIIYYSSSFTQFGLLTK